MDAKFRIPNQELFKVKGLLNFKLILKMSKGIFSAQSSVTALIFNGKPQAILRPWHI